MRLKEADRLFATSGRVKAVESFIEDDKRRRMLITGLAGSSPSMLFSG